jgi:signal transduction histidine kinase
MLGLTLGGAALITAVLVDASSIFPWGLAVTAAVIVGGLLTWRVPDNLVGWLLFTFGSTAAISVLMLTLAGRMSDPVAAGWVEGVANAINTAGVMALPAVFLRFPEGRRLSPRWRGVEWMVIAAAVLGASGALVNAGWGGDVDQAIATPPLRETLHPLGEILPAFFFPLMLVVMLSGAVSLILRYRSSTGEERLKIKWLAYAGFFLIAAFTTVAATGNLAITLGAAWAELLVALAFASVPVAIGLAVLQYRLYDIDIVINRTFVFVSLAVFITAVYTAIVVGVGSLIGGRSDDLVLPVIAIGVVAVAFEPVRHQAQRWANRMVYGRRATPYEVLSDLTGRLSHAEQLEGVLGRMAGRLRDGTGADRATVWLGEEGVMRPVASSPEGSDSGLRLDLAADHVFPVRHDGEMVGALDVLKPRGIALSSAEKALITDLAGSAGAVLGNQRLNESLMERARELEASRARLLEAQDRERRRLERDLHDGAQQLIVALKVKLGLARALAAREEASDLERLIDSLAVEAQQALDEVRALARGIYPPVLTSDGIVSAVSSLVASVPVEVMVEDGGIGRYEGDVEAAVYFDISEAVTNAVKHGAGSITIELAETDGILSFSVSDNGPGFDAATANGGSGLQNMRDRINAVGGELDVRSIPGEGTTISGWVPLQRVRA